MPSEPMHIVNNDTNFNHMLVVGELGVVYFLFAFAVVATVSKCGKDIYNKCADPVYRWYTRRNIETLHDNLISTSSAICSICLDDYSDPEIKLNKLPCNHVFHKYCIQEWLKNNDTCPECRMEI